MVISIKSRRSAEEENEYFKKGIRIGEIRFRRNIVNKLSELEEKYKKQYGCEIIEMYADIVSDLKDWLDVR